MKYIILSIKLLVLLYFAYLTYFLTTGYHPEIPTYRPPFLIWVIDIINLYIHEAGHFFFKILGRWMYFLGGSLFQCLIPLALLIVTARQNPSYLSYAGLWLGESLINVSVYVKDAPFKKLPLIAKGLIHDWGWLLSGNLEIAEPLGDGIFIIGILIWVSSIIIGFIFAIRDFRWYQEPSLPD